MARVAIVGGHGKIARLLIPRLVAAGHEPVALVRKPAYTEELEGLGARVAILDIESQDSDAFADAFEGSSAVVFAAGGGADGNAERKRTVDLEGSTKSIAAAKEAGISRFVQISAISVDKPVADDAEPSWRAYVEAKRDADIALRASGLDWTIVRPGGLTDDAATGRVTLGAEVDRGQIPRDDVAALIVACLENDGTIGLQIEAVGGPTPIAEALASIVS